MAMLIKLLLIRMNQQAPWFVFKRQNAAAVFPFSCSRRSKSLGVKEKKATSEPEINAEQISNNDA